jgi:hypothetical protein
MADDGAVVLIAGCTGGMGSILLKKLDEGGSFQGRPIKLLIALDYFPDAAAGPAQLMSTLSCPCMAL